MTQGVIDAVEEDAVKIDGNWYRLGPKVKAEYLRNGKCEYSVDEDGETATFIKMEKSETQRSFGKSKPKPLKSINDSQFRDPSEIIREGCLMAAVKLSVANYGEGDRAVEASEVIRMAKKFEEYVADKVEAEPE